MADQLPDVATNDFITSSRTNLINDMIDDGSAEINTLFLEIGGITTIDASRNISGDTLALIQTATAGAGLAISRNLAATSTDSAIMTIANQNASDDQPALSIDQDGDGTSVLIAHAGSDPVINITDSGIATYDLQSTSWSIRASGRADITSIYLGGNQFVDANRIVNAAGVTATSLDIGSTSILSTGAATIESADIGALSIDSGGNFDINSGNASIDVAGDADFNSITVQGNPMYAAAGFFAPSLASDPVTPINGQIWYNTTESALKIFITPSVRIIQTF